MPTSAARGNIKGKMSRHLTTDECADIAMAAQTAVIKNIDQNTLQEHAVLWLERCTEIAVSKNKHSLRSNLQLALLSLFRHSYQRINCDCSTEAKNTENIWSNKNHDLKHLRSAMNCKGKTETKCGKVLHRASGLEMLQNSLCQGNRVPDFILSQLPVKKNIPPNRCHYVTNGDPRLLLTPVKVEEANRVQPYVAVYHNFITDSEAKELKSMQVPFHQAQVKSNNRILLNSNRVGETGSLENDKHNLPLVRKLYNRIEAVTGLRLNVEKDYSEQLRISSYPPTGFFNVHFDYRQNNTLDMNNRMVTIVTYLNDVFGGETVFPRLNIRVLAKKGNAVIFHNLFRNGLNDFDSVHSGCPIWYGEKWIYTQWIHRYGQEFTRSCSLNRED